MSRLMNGAEMVVEALQDQGVDTVFGYPGIGQALVSAVTQRDTPVVQSIALILAAFYIGTNIIADLIVVLLVPKLRTTV